MNDKIQAIFLKLILGLKNEKWIPSPDWEITLKSEQQVTLQKNINVENYIQNREIEEDILTTIDIRLSSDDRITYFPEYTIYASILIDGGVSEDITYKTDASVAFTDKDIRNDSKIKGGANEISRFINEYVGGQFGDYCEKYGEQIALYYSSGEAKYDNDEDDFDDR